MNMAVSVPFQVNYDEFYRGMKYIGVEMPQASRGLQLQSPWRIPAVAVS